MQSCMTPSVDACSRSVEKGIKEQIARKLDYSKPYYAMGSYVRYAVTDMDSFPYQRYYRGDYRSAEPIVMDREAGWRPQENRCYVPEKKISIKDYPSNCFQTACSTTYPCYPNYLKLYSDKNEMELLLNRKCVIKSP